MTTAVVANGSTDGFRDRIQFSHQIVNRFVSERRSFQCLVDVRDVGLVMLRVMDLHRACINVWFQRRCGVGQGGKCVWHRKWTPSERLMAA